MLLLAIFILCAQSASSNEQGSKNQGKCVNEVNSNPIQQKNPFDLEWGELRDEGLLISWETIEKLKREWTCEASAFESITKNFTMAQKYEEQARMCVFTRFLRERADYMKFLLEEKEHKGTA